MSELKNIIDRIKQRDLDKALELCELSENSNNKHIILNFKGVVYLLKNSLDLAESNFLNSIRINEKFEDPIKNLYSIYLKKKDYKNLLIYANKLVEIDKLNIEYKYQFAFALELNNNQNEAIKNYNEYINFGGKNKKQALNNIGCIYLKRNKPKIANDFFLKGVNFGEDKIIINNILYSYVLLRDLKNSNIYLDKAKKIDENFIDFKFNKAKYLILKNQIDEAVEILKENKAIPKFLITLLILYSNTNQKEVVDKLLDQSIDGIKDDPMFLNYYGIKLLTEGNFNDGWKYYEYRNSKIVDFFSNTKEWTGEKIDTKNIVVFNEQGLGDSIQFSKYIIPLTKISKSVTFVVQSSIKNLFKNNIKNLSIETIETSRNKQFDFKIALGSLIKFFFKEKFEKNENLLQTNKDIDLKWKNKIDSNKLNIGFVWSGGFNGANEPYRSVPLKSLKKIFSLDANFYCLQNEVWDRDLDEFNSLDLINCGKYKLDEIASIILNLDLVITSDTSLLHLSSSLNKETWGMLSLYPDWRWGEFNRFNPYSSLKIFKQDKFNDWTNVEKEIIEELKKKIRSNI